MVFQPGKSGNPGGRVKGAKEVRDKLSQAFIRALLSSFEENGVSAIDRVIKEEPATYLKVIASIMPKELEISNNIGDLTDEQLTDVISALRSAISAGIVRDATAAEGGAIQAKEISSLH